MNTITKELMITGVNLLGWFIFFGPHPPAPLLKGEGSKVG